MAFPKVTINRDEPNNNWILFSNSRDITFLKNIEKKKQKTTKTKKQ
jgi:hypothetical protein